MALDPRSKESWQGFIDLMRPPPGYRVGAALGTTFGLSFEALLAALLAMVDGDAESLNRDPVAQIIAITRLRRRVRILGHPGTIYSPPHAFAARVVGLLDRFIAEVEPPNGLFHPKVWALRFDRVDSPATVGLPPEVGRILVMSRNLGASECFELGVAFEGVPAGRDEPPSPFARDSAAAMNAWLNAASAAPSDEVRELLRFVDRLSLDASSRQSADRLRLHWQGLGQAPLAAALPKKCNRTLVVSPFLGDSFVTDICRRSEKVTVLSTAEALDGIGDEAFGLLEAKARKRGGLDVYCVENVEGEDDERTLEGLHAKLVLVETEAGSATFAGSANGTGPGWGMAGRANVEAMVEMRPGVRIDTFLRDFVNAEGDVLYRWVQQYDRTARQPQDPQVEEERRLLALLRDVGALTIDIRFVAAEGRLLVSHAGAEGRIEALLGRDPAIEISVAPLACKERPDGYRPLKALAKGELAYSDVALEDVSAFLVLRATSKVSGQEQQRVILGALKMSSDQIERRDEAARDTLLASADPAAILRALIHGLGSLRGRELTRRQGEKQSRGTDVRSLITETTLERLLQAVAEDPTLIGDLRMLVAGDSNPDFLAFCNDLEAAHASTRVRA